MSHSHAPEAPTTKVVRVVSAKADIQPGQELTADQLGYSTIASPTAPTNAFTDPKELLGRVSLMPIVSGQLVLQDLLAPRGAAPGLPALVPAGKRAVTIDVNESSSIGGMLAPGCYVDVIGTISGNGNSIVARTIVQNILVQAVGQRLSVLHPTTTDDKDHKSAPPEPQSYRSVTLIASPKDAVTIQLASLQSRLSLLLRGTGDTSDGQASTTMAELRGMDPSDDDGEGEPNQPPQAVVAIAPTTQPMVDASKSSSLSDTFKGRSVITIHGTRVQRVLFDGPKGAEDSVNGPSANNGAVAGNDTGDAIPDSGNGGDGSDEPRGKER
jgi:pilus assembly protein CpaB